MTTQNVKCPSHTEYYITNICVLSQCTEPLCPECIPGHIRQHTLIGQIPQIENIQNVRQEQKAIVFDIVQKLNEQLFLLNSTDEKVILKNISNKLDQAKQELITMINQRFEEYQIELQNHFKQIKVNKDGTFKDAVDIAKQQLSKMQTLLKKFDNSDYIKAILETKLNNIGPHLYQTVDRKCQEYQQQFPDVIVNDRGLMLLKQNLDEYILMNQKVSTKQKMVTIKDSEIEQQILVDKKENNIQVLKNNVYIKSQHNSQISNNTKEYYSSQTSFKPQFVHNTSELMKAMQEGPSQPINILQKQNSSEDEFLVGCYGDQRRIMMYRLPKFIQPLKKQNITDFQEINLILDRRIAVGHQCVVYGKEILIIGGIERDVDRCQSIATVYRVNLIQKTLNLHSNMIHRRQGFGACAIDTTIFVCCGSSSDTEDNSINTLERFDGQRWSPLRSCIYACTGCTLGNVNNEYLIKIGGIDKEFLPVQTIEVYSIKQNVWVDLQIVDSQGNIWSDIPLHCGCEQINPSELLVFGGMIGEEQIDTSVIISLDVTGQTIRSASIRRSHSLPTTGCVDQVKIFEHQIYAVLTEGTHLIGAKKKVISCNSDKWIYIQNINE